MLLSGFATLQHDVWLLYSERDWLYWGILFLATLVVLFFFYKSWRDRERERLIAEAEWLRKKDAGLRRLFTTADWSNSIDDLSLHLIKNIKLITGAYRVYIHLYDVGNEFLNMIAEPVDLPFFSNHSIMTITTGRLSQIVGTHKPIINKNLSIPHPDDPDISGLVVSGCACGIALPMMDKDEMVGLCCLFFDVAKLWSDKEVEYYMDVGRVTGTMIASKRRTEYQKELAILEERKRISQELHDNFSQLTSGLCIRAEAAMLSCEEENAEKTLHDLKRIVGTAHEVQSSLREEMLGLRSTVDESCDLIPLLYDCLDRFRMYSNIPVFFDEGSSVLKIITPSQVGVQFIRIIQESLSNIRRHSNASRIDIRVAETGHKLRVEIVDNGVGFDLTTVTPDRLGLRIIQERAHDIGGTISIASSPNQGTCIQFDYPLIPVKENGNG